MAIFCKSLGVDEDGPGWGHSCHLDTFLDRLNFCCSFPLNNFWRDALISFKLCRTLYDWKVQVKFDIGNHPPNFGWVMALFRLNFCCSFPLNNFWRDALISFKLCRTLYHCKIQVKFDIGNHPPNFGWVMALFRLNFCCSFPLKNFWRDALITFKLFRTLYYFKIQVKFDIGNHLPNFG